MCLNWIPIKILIIFLLKYLTSLCSNDIIISTCKTKGGFPIYLGETVFFLFVFTGQILQLSCSTLTPDVFPKNIPAAAVPSAHSLFVGIPQFRVQMFLSGN